jgi:hypothetical protein
MSRKRVPDGTVVMLPFVVDRTPPLPPGTIRLRPRDGSKWSFCPIVTLEELERFMEKSQ